MRVCRRVIIGEGKGEDAACIVVIAFVIVLEEEEG